MVGLWLRGNCFVISVRVTSNGKDVNGLLYWDSTSRVSIFKLGQVFALFPRLAL